MAFLLVLTIVWLKSAASRRRWWTGAPHWPTMATKAGYPDSLCMIGRVGHFEDSINGVHRLWKRARDDITWNSPQSCGPVVESVVTCLRVVS